MQAPSPPPAPSVICGDGSLGPCSYIRHGISNSDLADVEGRPAAALTMLAALEPERTLPPLPNATEAEVLLEVQTATWRASRDETKRGK